MDLVRAALFWLDAAPWRGTTLLAAALVAVGALALRPARRAATHPAWFVLAILVAFAAARWTTWFYRVDLNPDEAQIVAGALTLDRFGPPWKFLDPTTHGPLCEYLLCVAAWLGAPFNYATARIVAALLQAGSLVAAWSALRRVLPESGARLAVLPGLAFWCLTSWDDFLHYSSELPGIFLMAWAVAGIARVVDATTSPRGRWLTAAGVGGLFGAVPYAKLQSAPEAAVLGLIALVAIWLSPACRAARPRLVTALLTGALVPSLANATLLSVYGQWHQFWYTYIISAVDFLATSAHPITAMPGRFLHFSATDPVFAWFFWGSLGFNLLYLRAATNTSDRRLVALAWLVVAVTGFTVLRPGRESVHYLHLLVIPLAWLTGITVRAAITGTGDGTRPSVAVIVALALLALAPQIGQHAFAYNRFRGHAREHFEAPPSAAARYLLAHATPGASLAMWGWAPHLHVETQMPHATREAQSGNQLMQWPLTPFYVDRYRRDLERMRPEWFVDAVGPGAFIFDDRASQGHESVPALKALIARDYQPVAELDGMRIYHRRPGAESPGSAPP